MWTAGRRTQDSAAASSRRHAGRIQLSPRLANDWGLFGKLSAIFGLMSLGFLQIHLGLQGSILLCVLFFFLSLVIAFFVDEKRGRAMARQHAGE